MSLAWHDPPQGSRFCINDSLFYGTNKIDTSATAANYTFNHDNHIYNTNFGSRNQNSSHNLTRNAILDGHNHDRVWPDVLPSSKRRKVSDFSCESTGIPYQQRITYENSFSNHANNVPPEYFNAYWNAPLFRDKKSALVSINGPDNASGYALNTSKRDRSKFEGDEGGFMSRDEIERCSPSRKDGIDATYETHLRNSYCAFLQNLGTRLDLPQTTIGTAMVLCHRFFVRRSHASHDRFVVATAVLFLASKSEETPRPLNDVLKVSCEIFHKQDFTLLSYMLPADWFEQYRERITDAEQLVLTTLNFELNVQHPYESLTSTLQKLGFSQSVLVNLALNLVSEGLRSSLWLQFKPHHIAAGAAYLGAKFLNMNLASCHKVWNEFQTPPSVLKDVAHQLMELF